MSDYIQKGQPYPVELYDLDQDREAREEIETLGLAARCQSWDQARIAAGEFLQAQHHGLVGGPASQVKLRIWKSRVFDDFPWCLRWVPKDIAP